MPPLECRFSSMRIRRSTMIRSSRPFPSAGAPAKAALGDTRFREASAMTFFVTLSGITLLGIGAAWFLDWGGGLVWIAGPATTEAHDAVAATARAHGGTHTLFRAPETLRAAVAVIPPEPAALSAIAARVKSAFDPRGILNPGRMRAGE